MNLISSLKVVVFQKTYILTCVRKNLKSQSSPNFNKRKKLKLKSLTRANFTARVNEAAKCIYK